MTDVGRRAGVSAQTVSRYFNDGYVSHQARGRIQQAVDELAYVPNRLPVQLRVSRTDTIGVVLFGPLNYGNAAIMTGMYRAARELGQSVMTTHMEPDPQAGDELFAQAVREVEGFVAARADAVIIASPYRSVTRLVARVGGAVPVVLLAELEEDSSDAVGSYSYRAARGVVEHLVLLGHRAILHVAGPRNRVQAQTRRQAYLDVVTEAGLAPLPVLECEEWEAGAAARQAGEVDPASFTAVFAANDDLALGFMATMRERGQVPPQDYGIAGFDDMPQARFLAPPLTTAHVDFERIGEVAMRRAVGEARGEAPARSWTVPVELRVRASTVGSAGV